MTTNTGTLEIGGRIIRVTNLDRLLYPADNVTKSDVITYYVQVAPRMLAVLARRPITRIRWPHGVDHDRFFEKQLPSHAPDWIDRVTFEHSDGPITYPFIDETAALVWFAQHNALELHVPQWQWRDEQAVIDRLVLDLDPGPGCTLRDCAEIAWALKELLARDGLNCYPVTSGSKGLHLYARWDKELRGSSSEYAKRAAATVARAFPDRVVMTMSKSQRDGRILIDWSQNNPAKTTVAPYSLRGREHPFVAAPRNWDELADPDIAHLTMAQVLQRLSEPDPRADLVDG